MPIGAVRAIDPLGRVVLPKEMRASLNTNIGDLVDIYVDGGRFIIAPLKLQCVACGSTKEEELKQVNGVHMCSTCIKKFGGDNQ